MARSNVAKRINQETQMRKRYHNIIQLRQQKYHLLERLGCVRREFQKQRTNAVHRDNVSADIRNPEFLRQSIRIRNLQAQIEHFENRINRIRALNHE